MGSRLQMYQLELILFMFLVDVTVAVIPSHTTILDREKIAATKNLARKDFTGHVGHR